MHIKLVNHKVVFYAFHVSMLLQLLTMCSKLSANEIFTVIDMMLL
jgi:hypothetical protein